ncbi:hypothetical protein [Hyalangium gracile]|uniref:hypothetical protein n=1 Tax=Hyalangium gracile TaxID=394092 RepID=UPI001CCA1703|nr:hypothetical protein [Hyalangium gracile]
MKTIAALICLLGLLGTIPAHAAESTDVLGRQVPVGQGRPALVLYANRGTRDELRTTAYPFIYGLRGAQPIIVVHVDLRDVPGLFKGLARKELVKSYRSSLEEMRRLFREKGEAPPVDLESSFFLVADSKGHPHDELGLKKGFDQVVAQALSPSGQELARGPFPQSAPAIGNAIGAKP